tara:strand:- start:211 stop:633 length:423 start_codon:yes stop_codon:yes gene_type:complete
MIEEAVKHPPRGKGKNTLMLEAIRAEMGDKVGEHEFLRKVIRVGLGQDGEDPNPTLLTLVVSRITPPLKSTTELVDFDFDKTAKPHEQAAQVLHAVSNGDIPADIGIMFVSAIKSMIDIEEYTDLKERIEKLEATLNGES